MADKPYLTYYTERGIIPVRQDIRELDVHMARRRALYRHLGMQPLTFRNRRILEFGPGTGDNALYIESCRPELYVLVDGNPASIQAISEKLEQGMLPAERIECRMSDIIAYRDTRHFDVVLCEGVVPCQRDPEAFLSHVASFAGPDSLLVITTMSPASVLAEVCRRVIKPIFSLRIRSQAELLKELVSFFEPDLLSLPGMSRLHEDWVLDNILHPWPARCTFSILEAIGTLEDNFDFLGSSPSFVQDWRWYKSVPRSRKTWNDIARSEYDHWAAYLLDYRLSPGDSAERITGQLETACKAALDAHYRILEEDALAELPQFTECLREIRGMIMAALPNTAASISDWLRGLDQLLDGDMKADFGSFRTWFGRGQQHVSFSRR